MESNKPREVILCGINMRPLDTEFKPPVKPGWKLVAATRQPFGVALIYERETEEEK